MTLCRTQKRPVLDGTPCDVIGSHQNRSAPSIAHRRALTTGPINTSGSWPRRLASEVGCRRLRGWATGKLLRDPSVRKHEGSGEAETGERWRVVRVGGVDAAEGDAVRQTHPFLGCSAPQARPPAGVAIREAKNGGMMKLTKPQRRALEILRDAGGPLYAHEFALRMWPRTDERWKLSWERSHNCGPNGSTTGAPMWMNGGRMLWRLWEKSLAQSVGRRVGWADKWAITKHGLVALAVRSDATEVVPSEAEPG